LSRSKSFVPSSRQKEFRHRFKREARTIATLNHPHVCALYDIAEHKGCAYLVMEYVEGETLDKVLARRALSTDEVLKLATDLIGEVLDWFDRYLGPTQSR